MGTSALERIDSGAGTETFASKGMDSETGAGCQEKNRPDDNPLSGLLVFLEQ